MSSKWLHFQQRDAGSGSFSVFGHMHAGNWLVSEAQAWVGWTKNGSGHHLVSAQVQRQSSPRPSDCGMVAGICPSLLGVLTCVKRTGTLLEAQPT